MNELNGTSDSLLTPDESARIKSFFRLLPEQAELLATQLEAADVIARVGAPSRLDFEVNRKLAKPLGDGITLVARLTAVTPAGDRCNVSLFVWQGWLHSVSLVGELPASFAGIGSLAIGGLEHVEERHEYSPRPMTDAEMDVILRLLEAEKPGFSELRQQVSCAKITHETSIGGSYSCAFEIERETALRASGFGGQPVEARSRRANGVDSSLLLFADHGWLSSMEVLALDEGDVGGFPDVEDLYDIEHREEWE